MNSAKYIVVYTSEKGQEFRFFNDRDEGANFFFDLIQMRDENNIPGIVYFCEVTAAVLTGVKSMPKKIGGEKNV